MLCFEFRPIHYGNLIITYRIDTLKKNELLAYFYVIIAALERVNHY